MPKYRDDQENDSDDSFKSINDENEYPEVPAAAAAVNSKKITVLSYSDKNNALNPNQQQHLTTSYEIEQPKGGGGGGSGQLSSLDDYVNSNRLNDIVVSNSIELHYFCFHNDIHGAKKFIQKHKQLNHNLSDYLSIRDIHGNTPLHLCCMLGHLEIAQMLTNNGAVAKARNKQMWTPLDEAISYGNRDLIKCVLKKLEKEIDDIVDTSKPKINTALKEMPDFYVEIKWDFETWIPLISRFLPSDTCKLYKKGSRIRLDCTLGDLARTTAAGSSNGGTNGNESSSSSSSSGPSVSASSVINWQRGDLTFIFDIEKIGEKGSLIYLDNKRKIFSNILDKQQHEVVEATLKDLDKEIDILLSRETIHVKLNTLQALFVPTQTGWFIKKEKQEVANGYMCQFYDVNNLYIVSKLRSEHLTDEDMKKREEAQKKMKQQLMKSGAKTLMPKSNSKSGTGSSNQLSASNPSLNEESINDLEDIDLTGNVDYRPDLEPPEKTKISWNEYIGAPEGQFPTLGRTHRNKESKKEFKAQLAMSQDFPLTLNDLNKLLDALAPLAKFRKLKEFVNQKLPPGFPVKIDIPIVPTVSAKVSFQNFRHDSNIKEDTFKVPESYTEENIIEKMKSTMESKKLNKNNNSNNSSKSDMTAKF